MDSKGTRADLICAAKVAARAKAAYASLTSEDVAFALKKWHFGSYWMTVGKGGQGWARHQNPSGILLKMQSAESRGFHGETQQDTGGAGYLFRTISGRRGLAVWVFKPQNHEKVGATL